MAQYGVFKKFDDLVNDLGELAEYQEAVLKLVQQSLPQLNAKVLNTNLQHCGTARIDKLDKQMDFTRIIKKAR